MEMTFEKVVCSISGEFLTRPFPSESEDWGIDAMIEYVDSHKIERFELFDSVFLWELIVGIAETLQYDLECDQ